MSNIDKTRKLHKILDGLLDRNVLDSSDIAQLRAALPELPIQKTLEEIAWDIDFARAETYGNDWEEDTFGVLEVWLNDLHTQLRAHLEGVKGEAVPRLPEGMRLADHADFGRVVVSPRAGIDRCHEIFYLDPGMTSGTDISAVESDSLTFIDSEPARPKFLETEADYANAPEGTIVTKDDCLPWAKEDIDDWTRNGGSHSDHGMARSGRRYILRWGWGE